MNAFEDFEWNGIGKRDPISDYNVRVWSAVVEKAWREACAWSMLSFPTIAQIESVRLDVEIKV